MTPIPRRVFFGIQAVAVALAAVLMVDEVLGSEARLPATLGGITLGESFAPVSARLGKPVRVVKDDGAAFGTEYIYEGLTLWAGLGAGDDVVVLQVEVTSSRYCTPSGICPGASIGDVQRVLGTPIQSDAVTNGRNDFLVSAEACWLEVDAAKQVVTQMAIRCQP